MTNNTITIVVAASCGVIGLVAYVGLVLVPAVLSYSKAWERVAAGFLTIYVLAAMLLLGIGGGALVVYFWDRLT